jgi:hypothetical protein
LHFFTIPKSRRISNILPNRVSGNEFSQSDPKKKGLLWAVS